jgi:hypothetical protein
MTDGDVGYDENFQRRIRKLSVALMWALGMVLVLGIGGVLGKGPVAHTQRENGGLRVEYDRFARSRTESLVVIEMPATQGDLQLVVGGALVKGARIDHSLPVITTARFREGELDITLPAGSIDAGARLTLVQKAQKLGPQRSYVQANGQRVDFTQLVWP